MQSKNGMKQFSTQLLVMMALLVALQVVLGKIVQINLVSKELNLGFLPVALAGALLGPIPAAVVGALGDVIGSLLFPTGAYFPGFTLTSALVGVAYGLALHAKKPSWVWVIVAAVSGAMINLLLNSLWLSMLYGSKTYWGWIAARAGSYLVETPVQVVVIYLMLSVFSHIRLPKALGLNGKETR